MPSLGEELHSFLAGGKGQAHADADAGLAAIYSYYSGVFLYLCALDHLLVATVLRRQYEYYLARAMNPFRQVLHGDRQLCPTPPL
jgi:hypothetical protein